MSKLIRILLCFLFTATAVPLVGCGGEDEKNSAPTTPSEKQAAKEKPKGK